jgi:hypothetical protein
MATVKLGPFSEFHYSSLTDKLAKANVTVQRIDDIELLNQYLESKKHEGIKPYPTYSGGPEFIFIEMDMKDLLIIKGDLDDLGYPLIKKEPLPDAQEFLCPQCKFVSNTPGYCPKHQVRLLEFSQWVEFQRTPKPRDRIVSLLIFCAVIGFIILLIIASQKRG